ncbi:TPA: hypothetical protein PFE25_003096 [Kluyvera ascorbata]|nr:hypothetical protein [Kluyvera ascorbata]HDG1709921.1 hypothetical protein [Kluyvera ascorbata]
MQENVGFNRRTGIFFILLLLGYGAYQLSNIFNVYEELHGTYKVDSNITLYVTRVSKSALSEDTYRYYFYDANKKADYFMSHIRHLTPTMETNDNNVMMEIKEKHIYFRIRGNVLSFNNSGIDFIIHIDVSPN